MTTLVTGASGFVGAAVVRALVARGDAVRVLLRPQSDRRNLAGLPLEVAEGDLRDPDSLARAVRGCRYLYHVAADYRLWVPDPQQMYAVNVTGSEQLLRAAAGAGIERCVYTSSVATIGLRPDGPADEHTPASEADMIGVYKLSKFLAERAVRDTARALGLPVVIVNPSTPLGPGDIKPTPTGRIVLDCLQGRMPACVDTGLNICHVDDVATGHLLAMERGQPDERYIIGGENLTLQEILRQVAHLAGRPAPRWRIPHGLAMLFAVLSEGWAGIAGGEPRATRDGVRMARHHMYFSSARAERELGYRPRPASEAIAAAVEWFRDWPRN